jgi:membrane protein
VSGRTDTGQDETPASDSGNLIARWRGRAENVADRYLTLAEANSLYRLPLTFGRWYLDRQGLLMASAVAFRLFLWLMPLSLLFAGILAGTAGSNEAAAKSLTNAAGVTGTAGKEVVAAMADGNRSWWIAVVIGGAGSLWGAKTLLRCLWLVHAHVWQIAVPKRRPSHVIVTVFVFLLSWAALFAISAVAPRLDRALPGGVLIAVVVEIALATVVWLAISLRLPHGPGAWYDLMPGALAFGVTFAVLHAVGRVYIPRKLEHSSQLYGVLGIAAVILTWLLIIGQVIVGAALTNAVWHSHRQSSAHELPGGHRDHRAGAAHPLHALEAHLRVAQPWRHPDVDDRPDERDQHQTQVGEPLPPDQIAAIEDHVDDAHDPENRHGNDD